MDSVNQRPVNETPSNYGERYCCTTTEREVPGGGQTDIVIAVVIRPVVDIEALRVEVADIDAVAVRGNEIACAHPRHRKLRFTFRLAPKLCPLLPVFYAGVSTAFLVKPPLSNKQEVQSLSLITRYRTP